jgi:hypothetical protein
MNYKQGPGTSEPVFVNVYGAQELIKPGWESIPRLLNRFTNTGSRKVRTTGSLDNWKKNLLEKSEHLR